MINYRDTAPEFLKDITSDGIINFFEDSRATKKELIWFKNTITSEDYWLHKNPISKYNWGKIKSAFAREFFPSIAPPEVKTSTTEERLTALLNRIE